MPSVGQIHEQAGSSRLRGRLIHLLHPVQIRALPDARGHRAIQVRRIGDDAHRDAVLTQNPIEHDYRGRSPEQADAACTQVRRGRGAGKVRKVPPDQVVIRRGVFTSQQAVSRQFVENRIEQIMVFGAEPVTNVSPAVPAIQQSQNG